jgi:putative ABC transport system permease protein
VLTNYFKIAWRHIAKHKSYTAINVIGLSIGICACIVIYLIAVYEFSFDSFHPGGDRIYRITGEMQNSSGEKTFLNSPVSEVAGFEKEIPGFEAKTAIHFYYANASINYDNGTVKKFDSRNDLIITSQQYFSIFQYEWLAGNKTSALNAPYKVVLTESKAQKYFGSLPLERIIGKTVVYGDSLPVTVAGIIKDWNQNTDLPYTDFISISTVTNSFLKTQIPAEDWSSLQPHQSMAFVKLNKATTAAQINHQFEGFIKSHVKPPPGASLSMRLQPLSDMHFTNDYYREDDGDNFRKAHLPTLYMLMGIALFILIIAAFNFINLSTAQSVKRAKEIGIRKVLGGKKANLVFQFLIETFVLTVFAAGIAILLVKPVLTIFSSFIPEGIKFDVLSPSTLLFLLLVVLINSLLAGFYPAKVLAAYLPVDTLKGTTIQTRTGKINLRKVLIVFQFTISLVFIIGAIVISKQISFMRNADKGFKTDAIITINNWGDRSGKIAVLAEKIKQLNGVDKVIAQGNAPMGFAHGTENFKYKDKNELTLEASIESGDENFIPFYGMELLAGRNMIHSDSLSELLINETCSHALGLANPHDAIGKLLYAGNGKAFPVVGVVKDFHEGSFHEAIKPVVIANMPERQWSIAVKLATKEKYVSNMAGILSEIEKQWKLVFPNQNFEYSFLDESITWLYEKDKQTAWLINAAMIITIFISCMGLFGLAMFTTQQRTKEIGIRKVLGASVMNITTILSKEFLRLVLISLLIATPIGWYFMNKWLDDFVYRTSITSREFVLAAIAAVVITLLAVGFQSIKAAIANPVKSLRSE